MDVGLTDTGHYSQYIYLSLGAFITRMESDGNVVYVRISSSITVS